jgi:transcriptional regulator with XRE-family HTH domain
MDSVGKRIAAARKARGYSQKDLADRVGVTRGAVGQWEVGTTNVKYENLEKLSSVLNVPVSYFTDPPPQNTDQMPTDLNLPLERPLPQIVARDVALVGTQDLPILGVAAGADVDIDQLGDDPFEINGEIMGRVRRPPSLANVPKAFAIQIIGSSMVPRRKQGELVVCTPNRVPAVGDEVVVELRNQAGEGPRPCIYKEFVGKSAGVLILRQLNPERIINLPADRVERMYKVLSTAELLGM